MTPRQRAAATEAPPVPLARLLAMAFRQLIDELHARLAAQGWTDVRPAYGFVLLAARDGELSASGIVELLGVTKQAASQLLDSLERDGYVERSMNPDDRRAKLVDVTDKARDLLATVEAIYADLEAEWARHIGATRLASVRSGLIDALRGVYGDDLPPVRPTW